MQKQITIYPGVDKDGKKEQFEKITLKLGEVISIVGNTGSGKTLLISDIEQLSQRDSVSKRQILIDDKIPDYEDRFNPEKKEIAMITQNTKCVSDLYVSEFIKIHANSRKVDKKNIVSSVIKLANKFTGEIITKNSKVTELSGGQTRALLFADAILIGASPIILVDEIENAGINKSEILKYVKKTDKLVIFVTHDPSIILRTEKRIVMKNGAITKIINRSEKEKEILNKVLEIDEYIKNIKDDLRNGVEFSDEGEIK